MLKRGCINVYCSHCLDKDVPNTIASYSGQVHCKLNLPLICWRETLLMGLIAINRAVINGRCFS